MFPELRQMLMRARRGFTRQVRAPMDDRILNNMFLIWIWVKITVNLCKIFVVDKMESIFGRNKSNLINCRTENFKSEPGVHKPPQRLSNFSWTNRFQSVDPWPEPYFEKYLVRRILSFSSFEIFNYIYSKKTPPWWLDVY